MSNRNSSPAELIVSPQASVTSYVTAIKYSIQESARLRMTATPSLCSAGRARTGSYYDLELRAEDSATTTTIEIIVGPSFTSSRSTAANSFSRNANTYLRSV